MLAHAYTASVHVQLGRQAVLATRIRLRQGVYTGGRKGCSDGDTATVSALQPLVGRSMSRAGFNG